MPIVLKAQLLFSYINGRTQTVFEKRMPRKIFGRNREEFTRRWTEIHIEDFRDCILRQIYYGDHIKGLGCAKLERRQTFLLTERRREKR